MSEPQPVVWVVDDDDAMRQALVFMLSGAGLDVRPLPAGQALLDAYVPAELECAVLDLQLPEIDGLELVRELRDRDILVPVVMLSGYATVSSAVNAMRLGVIDFLEKPVGREILLDRVELAIRQGRQARHDRQETAALRRKLAALTTRERELLELIVDGLGNKQIAVRLHIAEKTVANHRARLMEKMEAGNAADLVRMALEARS